MIISASRRTDIPALYARWFMNRVRTGFCTVPSARDASRHSTVSLRPADVGALVFWTRNPAPLLPHLDELEARGLGRSIFLFTLLDYPSVLEPGLPPLEKRLAAFESLSRRLGPERIIWRYDPIYASPSLDACFHRSRFQALAERLGGQTSRCIISFMEPYAKANSRLNRLPRDIQPVVWDMSERSALLADLASIAAANEITLTTCSQPATLASSGVANAACIDGEHINRLFNLTVPCHKDRAQRERCLCAVSRDIGAYDTCTHGCPYCYANSDFNRSRTTRTGHDPEASSLCGNAPRHDLPLLNFT